MASKPQRNDPNQQHYPRAQVYRAITKTHISTNY